MTESALNCSNATSLNSDNALLFLSWRYHCQLGHLLSLKCICTIQKMFHWEQEGCLLGGGGGIAIDFVNSDSALLVSPLLNIIENLWGGGALTPFWLSTDDNIIRTYQKEVHRLHPSLVDMFMIKMINPTLTLPLLGNGESIDILHMCVVCPWKWHGKYYFSGHKIHAQIQQLPWVLLPSFMLHPFKAVSSFKSKNTWNNGPAWFRS